MRIFTACILFICLTGLKAQNSNQNVNTPDHFTCDHYSQTEAFFDAHPGQRAKAEQAEATLDYFTRNYREPLQKDDELRIIPVVFHVIHYGGAENISNAQIYSAIEVLNEDYSAGNPLIGTVIQEFEDRVADVEFEFRLAKIDPDGNCTSGIVRVFDTQTFDGGDQLKQISPSWGRESYLNIWVCETIGSGAAGYAYYPSAVVGSQGAQKDGIVIRSNYVGRIGTSNVNRSHSLSHEAGHWANLAHPWGSSNSPTVPSNCNTDDGIADTPNTIGWDSCELMGTTCGSLDNVQNFMDYSYCSEMFTLGQKNRMRATLSAPVSNRNQLWTPENLAQTGVLEDDIVCEADFITLGETVICPGGEVEFSDMSFNGPTSWSWTFTGGSPASSSEQNPVVTFDEPGTYDVTLTASNENGSASITKNGFITVIESGENSLPYSEGFEFFNTLHNYENWFVINPDNSNVAWELTDVAAYSGTRSIRVRGRLNSNGAVETVQSPTFDLTGLSDDAGITFKYAHARRTSNSNDELRIFISRDCGGNWNPWLTIGMDDLPTVSGTENDEFIPDSQNEWTEVELSGISSFFLTDEFRLRFQFTSYAGNDLYIDNINVFDPNSVGIEEVEFLNYIKLYPNPTQLILNINYGMRNSGSLRISVVDLTGRTVIEPIASHKPAGEHSEKINIQSLSPGVYFVRIESENEQVVRKLVVQ